MHSEPNAAHVFSCYDDEKCAGDCATKQVVPTRGVLWVLRWVAALVVLVFSCGVLTEFAYCLAAEHSVARAARAGALEATLPRANTKTIAESVTKRLTVYSTTTGQVRLMIQQNGKSVLGRLKVQPGDRISVHVTVPSTAVLPHWLARLKFWHGNSPIEASAERVMPGRKIFARNRKTRT